DLIAIIFRKNATISEINAFIDTFNKRNADNRRNAFRLIRNKDYPYYEKNNIYIYVIANGPTDIKRFNELMKAIKSIKPKLAETVGCVFEETYGHRSRTLITTELIIVKLNSDTTPGKLNEIKRDYNICKVEQLGCNPNNYVMKVDSDSQYDVLKI